MKMQKIGNALTLLGAILLVLAVLSTVVMCVNHLDANKCRQMSSTLKLTKDAYQNADKYTVVAVGDAAPVQFVMQHTAKGDVLAAGPLTAAGIQELNKITGKSEGKGMSTSDARTSAGTMLGERIPTTMMLALCSNNILVWVLGVLITAGGVLCTNNAMDTKKIGWAAMAIGGVLLVLGIVTTVVMNNNQLNPQQCVVLSRAMKQMSAASMGIDEIGASLAAALKVSVPSKVMLELCINNVTFYILGAVAVIGGVLGVKKSV